MDLTRSNRKFGIKYLLTQRHFGELVNLTSSAFSGIVKVSSTIIVSNLRNREQSIHTMMESYQDVFQGKTSVVIQIDG